MEPMANKFWDSQLGQLLQHNRVVNVIKLLCESLAHRFCFSFSSQLAAVD